MGDYELIVVGGGPAGSSVAWEAASAGARVLVCDKATFPRDKPCGDGITPRALKLLTEMNLEAELKRFHLVDRLRVFGGGRVLEAHWPAREGFPLHGYVAPRTEFDELLLRNAENAGAEVWEGRSATGPIVEDGCVRGIYLEKDGSEMALRAPIVIAADGASSRLVRQSGMRLRTDRPVAVALRAQVEAGRPVDAVLEAYFNLRLNKKLIPGYGWVFPMGDGRINVGAGLVRSGSWKRTNTAELMRALLSLLPSEWNLPSYEEMSGSDRLKGWSLPMGLSVWPPWRPGIMAVGDAAGVVKPFSGAGISKAIESGRVASRVALGALGNGGPTDLSEYADALESRWGAHYRIGRAFVRFSQSPLFMSTLVTTATRIPSVGTFLGRLVSDVYRERGGGPSDVLMRSLLRAASWERLDGRANGESLVGR